MKLSPRLAQVASFIPPGQVVADIGTDHACLPLYLVEKGISPRVMAIEAKEKPFHQAQQNLAAHPLGDKVDLRFGDGFSSLREEDGVEVAVLAGMGSLTIREILTGRQPVSPSIELFILQSMTRPEELRVWLADNLFRIVDEALVKDAGHIYEVLAVKRGEEVNRKHPFLAHGPGLILKKDPFLREYLENKIRKTKIVLNSLSLSRGEDRKEIHAAFSQRLKLLEEVMALVSAGG